MKRIELLGPSGVGKTTLYKQICKVPALNRPYITHREAYIKAAKYGVKPSKFNLYLYQVALKSEIFRSKRLGLAKTILRDLKLKEEIVNESEYARIEISTDIFLNTVLNESNPLIIKKRFDKFMKRVDELILLEHFFSNDEVILFDEGVLHKHYGITDYGLKKFPTDKLTNDAVLNPAGIISCEQTVQVIYEQALKRKENGIYTLTHGPLSNTELRERIEQNLNAHLKKISLFLDHGIPILRINTGEEFTHILEKIQKFLVSIN